LLCARALPLAPFLFDPGLVIRVGLFLAKISYNRAITHPLFMTQHLTCLRAAQPAHACVFVLTHTQLARVCCALFLVACVASVGQVISLLYSSARSA